jgi:hypothetical protein
VRKKEEEKKRKKSRQRQQAGTGHNARRHVANGLFPAYTTHAEMTGLRRLNLVIQSVIMVRTHFGGCGRYGGRGNEVGMAIVM